MITKISLCFPYLVTNILCPWKSCVFQFAKWVPQLLQILSYWMSLKELCFLALVQQCQRKWKGSQIGINLERELGGLECCENWGPEAGWTSVPPTQPASYCLLFRFSEFSTHSSHRVRRAWQNPNRIRVSHLVPGWGLGAAALAFNVCIQYLQALVETPLCSPSSVSGYRAARESVDMAEGRQPLSFKRPELSSHPSVLSDLTLTAADKWGIREWKEILCLRLCFHFPQPLG